MSMMMMRETRPMQRITNLALNLVERSSTWRRSGSAKQA